MAWAEVFKRVDAAKPRKEGAIIEVKMVINVSTNMISISVKPPFECGVRMRDAYCVKRET